MRGINSDVEEISGEIVKEIVELSPNEMRDLMSDNPPSAFGSPPAVRSGDLSRSLQGRVIDRNTGEIQMIGYAEFLDPLFGGKLNRPFILTGIDRQIVRTIKSL